MGSVGNMMNDVNMYIFIFAMSIYDKVGVIKTTWDITNVGVATRSCTNLVTCVLILQGRNLHGNMGRSAQFQPI